MIRLHNLVLLCAYVGVCQGWLMPSSSFHCTRLYEQSMGEGEGADDSPTPPSEEKQDSWLEEWALEGAAKIAQLDLHERTQRAMLAEMAEDKIYENTVALEKLVDEDTGEITDAAKDIALQMKSLQSQYKALVTGEESTMLKAMASLTERKSRSDKE
ncbi:MAG: hypothetical protein SGILL_008853 [Bacillariaceae sp.]